MEMSLEDIVKGNRSAGRDSKKPAPMKKQAGAVGGAMKKAGSGAAGAAGKKKLVAGGKKGAVAMKKLQAPKEVGK